MKIHNKIDWFGKELNKLDKDIDSLSYKYVLDFSENILEILSKKGIQNKNKYLAKKLNCSPAYISKLFNGRSNFTVRKLVELAKAVDYELKINLSPRSTQLQLHSEFTACVNISGRLENFSVIDDQRRTVNVSTTPESLNLFHLNSAA